MADSKIFRMRGEVTIEGIGREVENFLRNEKELTVEGFASSDGYLVQAKESSTWKKFTGLGQALQVQIIPSGTSEVLVNIGQGKWADKVGAGAVGALLFAPLAITSVIGAYKQNKLPSEIFACIEKFIMSGGQSVRRNVSFDRLDSSQMKCPACGAVNLKGTKFCSGCGKKLTNSCPNCGKEVVLGIKFCPNCGANMAVTKSNACPNCGNEVAEGQKFCPNCGTNMDVLNKDKCPNCGALVDKGQKFCPECGSTMSGNKICDNCGAELSPNQKFCSKCGTPASP